VRSRRGPRRFGVAALAASVALCLAGPVTSASAAAHSPGTTKTPTTTKTGTKTAATAAGTGKVTGTVHAPAGASSHLGATPGDRLAKHQAARRSVVAAAVVSGQSVPVVSSKVSAASAVAGTPGYTPLAPYRVLDTRYGTGAPKAAVGQRGYVDVKVTGVGGVPATGVDAVVVNVTVTAPTATGWVAVYPTGAAVPTASNLNFTPGLTVANLVISKVGTNGSIRLYNYAGSTQLVADINGYMATGSAYTAQSPVRILDTRLGVGAPTAKVGAGATIDLQVAGVGGVPASGVGAVALNVTATNVSGPSYVTVFPSGATRPTTSNLNMATGQTVPVLVMATLGSNGKVSLYNLRFTTDLIADVAGWYATGGEYHPLTPARIFDSRQGFGALQPGGGVDLQLSGYGGVPIVGETSVVLSVTAVTPTTGGYLTVFPYNNTWLPPKASSLNFNQNTTVPNLVIAKIGAGGWISIYNPYGNTHVVVDVMGWFSTTLKQGLAVGASESASRDVPGASASVTSVDGVSSDGRYTAFTSTATSLAPYRTSTQPAVFVRDNVIGITTEIAWSDTAAVTGAGMSSDGRYVLFTTTAAEVTGDTNGLQDVYMADLSTDYYWLASFDPTGQTAGNAASLDPTISPSGQYIAFVSNATNLAPGATGTGDIMVVDMWATAPTAATLVGPGTDGNLTHQGVSDNGSVAYAQAVAPTNVVAEIYAWDSATKTSAVVSQTTAGVVQTAGRCWSASISADSRYVAFTCDSALDAKDANSVADVYLRDRTGATTTLVSGTTTAAGNAASDRGMVSADGSTVVFQSKATNLTASATGLGTSNQVLSWNRTAGTSTLVSAAAGTPANGDAVFPVPGATGAFAAYWTNSTNLVTGSVPQIAVVTRVS